MCEYLFSLTAYKNGKEYIYTYESQILSGLPMGGKTWSGLKLRSDIHVQVYSPWKFKLQVCATLTLKSPLKRDTCNNLCNLFSCNSKIFKCCFPAFRWLKAGFFWLP